jgi:hypothetical protein
MLTAMTLRPISNIGRLGAGPARVKVVAAAFVLLLSAAVGGTFAAGAHAQSTTTYSTNWSGYAVRASERFSSVSGSWIQPGATCTSGSETYSAVWIGLGGYRAHAKALEQIGTDADCTRDGQARHSSWLELVPAGPVALRIAVHAGDRMSATVSVAGREVTLRLRDASTGAHIVKRLRMKHVDVSSAEWIVEAPSLCEAKCQTLTLTDFDSASFASASAKTRSGHVGSLGDAAWSTTRLILRQSVSAGGEARHAGTATAGQVLATPGEATAGGAFSVLWSQLNAPSQEADATPPPTLGGDGA